MPDGKILHTNPRRDLLVKNPISDGGKDSDRSYLETLHGVNFPTLSPSTAERKPEKTGAALFAAPV